MKTRISMIMSALALVISLTGAGAYAAAKVNGSTIMNHSIGVGKLTPLAVKQLKGHAGEDGFDGMDGVNGVGIQGPPGATGAVGATGTAGGFNPAKVTYVEGPDTLISPGTIASATAFCPVGSKVVGGGFFSSVTDVGASVPNFGGGFWGVVVQNNTPIFVTVNAYAVCAAA